VKHDCEFTARSAFGLRKRDARKLWFPPL